MVGFGTARDERVELKGRMKDFGPNQNFKSLGNGMRFIKHFIKIRANGL